MGAESHLVSLPNGCCWSPPDKYTKLSLYKLSSFSLPLEQKLRGERMPRAHTAVSSPASVPVSHSTPPDTQAVAEWTGAFGRPSFPSLHSPSWLPTDLPVAAIPVIPQTTHLRPRAESLGKANCMSPHFRVPSNHRDHNPT